MKVSVVIPVYNVKPYLERCVQSVIRQTYKDLEIILVDDGSTDGSGDLCDQLAVTDKRICVIHQENQGLSGARNTGIRQATGEYVIFLDSDDEWLLNDGLERILHKGNNGDDLIVFKNVHIWNGDVWTKTRDYDLETIDMMPNSESVFSHLVTTQQFRMSACFLLVRRQLLIDNDIFFPKGYISEDVFWSLHLWQCVNKVAIVNIDFYGYYHRGSSITTSPSLRVYESYDKIFSYWKEHCEKGCKNAASIRNYLAEMWTSRGYGYYMLKAVDRPGALNILQRHADLLQYAVTPKSQRADKMAKVLGVRVTVMALGWYWRLRNRIKG
jgi:raffinose-raffinose alpha-galactotransferase